MDVQKVPRPGCAHDVCGSAPLAAAPAMSQGMHGEGWCLSLYCSQANRHQKGSEGEGHAHLYMVMTAGAHDKSSSSCYTEGIAEMPTRMYPVLVVLLPCTSLCNAPPGTLCSAPPHCCTWAWPREMICHHHVRSAFLGRHLHSVHK